VAFESPHALAALATAAVRARQVELPKLDGLIKTATDKVLSVGRKSNRVHTVFVAVRILETLDKISGSGVPDSDTLIQRAGGDIKAIWRHSHGGDTIFDAEGVDKLVFNDIPEADGLVPAARGNVPAVACKVEGVDILLVASENVLDAPRTNVPNLLRHMKLVKQMATEKEEKKKRKKKGDYQTHSDLLVLSTSG
jgi:hypothetical protein